MKERALEAERFRRREQELKEQQEAMLTEQAKQKERQRALAEIAKTKERKTKEEQQVSEIAFKLIDKAENVAKQYESDIKEGI